MKPQGKLPLLTLLLLLLLLLLLYMQEFLCEGCKVLQPGRRGPWMA